jgi:hypothetical protein
VANNPADEALAGMAKVGAPRTPMGKGGIATSYPSAKPGGISVPRKNTQAGDPTIANKAQRTPDITTGSDRNGAKHTIVTYLSGNVDPSAGATQANGRIMNATIQRGQSQSFSEGVGTSY